jgi:hypothetical protein
MQVLSLNKPILASVPQTDSEPIIIQASGKIVSPTYKINVINGQIELRHQAQNPETSGDLMAAVPIKPSLYGTNLLLILSQTNAKLNTIVRPFSKEEYPMNTFTLINLTSKLVNAKFDRQFKALRPKDRYQMRYNYVYAQKESIKTKLAIEHNGRPQLLMNGFIPIQEDGRVLFLILPAGMTNEPSAHNLLSFKYACDLMRTE